MKSIEQFKNEIKETLEPVCHGNSAKYFILKLKEKAEQELNIKQSEVAELFENSFGFCFEIDNELESIFPDQFGNR